MSLFDDNDNILFEENDSILVSHFNRCIYYDILGEKLSAEINNNDETLFEVLRRELSKWLVCDRLVCDKCGQPIHFECGKVNPQEYEKGIYRYGQYSPSEKKITLDNTYLTDEEKEAAEIKASTVLHELMHAYFDCGLSRKPDLEIIEEPLAEAGMLDFLSHYKGRSFDNVSDRVSKKKETPCIAHYGFGAYIHEKSNAEVGTLCELYYKILHRGCYTDIRNFIEGLDEYKEYANIIRKPSQDERKYELLKSILKEAEKEVNSYPM